jgi:hypothetical protein
VLSDPVENELVIELSILIFVLSVAKPVSNAKPIQRGSSGGFEPIHFPLPGLPLSPATNHHQQLQLAYHYDDRSWG